MGYKTNPTLEYPRKKNKHLYASTMRNNGVLSAKYIFSAQLAKKWYLNWS